MAYITLSEFKVYIGVDTSDTSDDTLLQQHINSAKALIEQRTDKIFDASTDTTRYFNAMDDIDYSNRTLYLRDWIAAVPTTLTNGDGIVIPSNQFVMGLNRNKAPFSTIQLKMNSDYFWTFNDTPEDAISILGKWGFSTTAPDDIKQLSFRIAAFFYRQKDAQVFDQTVTNELGSIRIKAQLPKDIEDMLMSYQRLIV